MSTRSAVLAAVSGGAWALSLPPNSLTPLAFVGLVPLFMAIHGRSVTPRAGWTLGICAGATWAATTFSWIPFLPAAQTTVPWILWPAYAAAVVYLSAFVGAACALIVWLTRRLDWPLVAIAPFVWTVMEYVRGTGTMGCPWGSIAYAVAPSPVWSQGASIVGLYGLVLWIVLVNATIASVALCPAWRGRVVRAGLAACLLAIPWWYGHARLAHAAPTACARVALVQGNVSAVEKWDPAFKDSTLTLYDALTRRAASARARTDLFVWPETAAPSYVNIEPHDRDRIDALASDVNAPVLVGFPEATREPALPSGEYAIYNAAGLFRPGAGLSQTYRKRHLVPFGEAIPWSTRLRALRAINLGQGNFWPGREATVFDPDGTGRARFGVLICFESIFPELARSVVRAGADYLVVITNDEWFGRTTAPEQHAWMAVLRAVETGRGVVRCANTGLTWIIDPYGRVTARAPARVATSLTGGASRAPGETPYVRVGDVSVALSAIVAAGAVIVALRRARTGG